MGSPPSLDAKHAMLYGKVVAAEIHVGQNAKAAVLAMLENDLTAAPLGAYSSY
jgi:hypothetical protein